MLQVIQMSHSEKLEMYRLIEKDRLIEMLIEANNTINRLIEEKGLTYKISEVDFNLEEKSDIPSSVINCPVCKSENIGDDITYQNNGIIGHGFRDWKTIDNKICNDCGIIFKQVKPSKK